MINLDMHHATNILPGQAKLGHIGELDRQTFNSQNTLAIKLLALWPTGFTARTVSKVCKKSF